MTCNPKVSVIIPVYNVEDYIDVCLRSVANQTYTGPMECLLVDDCGNDRSMEIVDNFIGSYCGDIDFRILRHDTNRGLSAARNTGIDNATGDYLYFLDSDDEITPDCIENITGPLRHTAAPRLDFIIGDYRIIGEKKDVPLLTLKAGTTLQGRDIFETFIDGKWYMMAWNKLCNREFLIANRLYFKEGIIHEDDLWSFQLAYLAKTMGVVSHTGYIYKIRKGSITGNNQTGRSIKNHAEVMVSTQEFIKRHHIKLSAPLNQFIQFRTFYILSSTYRIFGKQEFSQTYHRLRTHKIVKPLDIIRCNRFSPKKIIRDLHLLLPTRLGATYEFFLISIMGMRQGN